MGEDCNSIARQKAEQDYKSAPVEKVTLNELITEQTLGREGNRLVKVDVETCKTSPRDCL